MVSLGTIKLIYASVFAYYMHILEDVNFDENLVLPLPHLAF